MKKILLALVTLLVVQLSAQPMASDVRIEQLRDGSGLVRICYRAVNASDSVISTNVLVSELGVFDEFLPVLTVHDSISGYDYPNFGWSVSASDTGNLHCFLWDMTTDLGNTEQCGFRGNIAVFDSVLSSYSITDSFPANDSARVTERAFGLAYKRGELWLMFHEDVTDYCWVRPYSMPDLIPGDSIFIGTVTVGPSDMAFAGDRLFWTEDTRLILKEYDWELGDSRAVRSDWWDLPGADMHLAGCTFDGQYLWVCFSAGTFVKLDTTDFSLVDTMFFPEFGVSTPATSADGLAWGLGILWCYSNDNVVYAIDPESKTIIHTIYTGAVVEMTGAEGAAWDGLNLWIVDYSRYYVYKLSLFDQISFYFSERFCLDNQAPEIIWDFPDSLGIDTIIAASETLLTWEVIDSNVSGGITELVLWEDTIAVLPASTFEYNWLAWDWPDFGGYIELIVTDFYGNTTHTNSGAFYLEENLSPEFLLCANDTIVPIETSISIPIHYSDPEDDFLSVSIISPSSAMLEGDTLLSWTSLSTPSDTTVFTVVVCDFHFCDTCIFSISTAPNHVPEFTLCPDDLEFIEEEIIDIAIEYSDFELDSIVSFYYGPDWLHFDGLNLSGVAIEPTLYPISIVICDEWACDTCNFDIDILPDLPPVITLCPFDTIFSIGSASSLIVDFFVEDPYLRTPDVTVRSPFESHILSDTAIVFIPDTAGIFEIEITACTGTFCDTCHFTITTIPSSILEQIRPKTRTIYINPNPFNFCVEISSPRPWEKLIIRDLNGKIVMKKGSASSFLWRPSLSSGVYFAEIHLLESDVITKRLLLLK